jgi:PleD family two-component response regulator
MSNIENSKGLLRNNIWQQLTELNWKDVMGSADKALYRAKNSGRNQVSE